VVLSAADATEYLFVEHTRRMLGRLFPKEGRTLSKSPPVLLTLKGHRRLLHDAPVGVAQRLYRFYGARRVTRIVDNHLTHWLSLGL
jgi:hypothetical protein